MNIKRIAFIMFIIFMLYTLVILTAYSCIPKIKLDTVSVNDIVQSASKNWDKLSYGDSAYLKNLTYKLDYTIINNNEDVLYTTRQGLSQSLNDAVANRDTLVDVMVSDKIAGKVIFHNDTGEVWKQNQKRMLFGTIIFLLMIMAFCLGYTLYINHNVFRPFRKLEKFAQRVAAGNLDIPLTMDRGNLFGAFTESFDLMREALSVSRESERKATQSKKELTAQLSHDIKTPVASIKAISELMLVKSISEKERQQLETICAKADQISLLVSNMFHATLEELQELKVYISEVPSTILYEIIKNADYDNRVRTGNIPECIILADQVRLQQVFDNIISNSYKYAGTSIDIEAFLEDKQLIIVIRDYGKGVPEEELPLLFNKFYRGKNADRISGSGLGLFISKHFMEQMSGSIHCKNAADGFTVTICLRIAGNI